MTLHANPARLLVHQIASENARDAIRLARTFNGSGGQARGDQLTRAALSVCSNIAEACGRGTIREFRRFLLYARGSAQELVSQLGVARERIRRSDAWSRGCKRERSSCSRCSGGC